MLICSSAKDVPELLERMNKLAATADQLLPTLEGMQLTLRLASALGFDKRLVIQPLNMHQHRFKNGVAFEVAWGPRRGDILAAAGR